MIGVIPNDKYLRRGFSALQMLYRTKVQFICYLHNFNIINNFC